MPGYAVETDKDVGSYRWFWRCRNALPEIAGVSFSFLALGRLNLCFAVFTKRGEKARYVSLCSHSSSNSNMLSDADK